MGDVSGDIYIRGGIPRSRYCRSCAHYQVLSGCSNSRGGPGARACLYILDTGHRRGCLPGYGCTKRITPAEFAATRGGREIMRQRVRSASGGAKNKGRGRKK